MYRWHGWGLFTNVIMYLTIVLDIVLGETLFKITLKFLIFY